MGRHPEVQVAKPSLSRTTSCRDVAYACHAHGMAKLRGCGMLFTYFRASPIVGENSNKKLVIGGDTKRFLRF